MAKLEFKVNIHPKDAAERVKSRFYEDQLIDSYVRKVDEQKCFYTLVFEKFYMRNSSRAALVVIIDNVDGVTKVNAVSTGSGNGMIFKFDWGASDDFVAIIEDALQKYIIK